MDECTVSLNATIHAADVAAARLYRTARNTIVVKAALEMLGRVKINEEITSRYADELTMTPHKANAGPRNEEQCHQPGTREA